MLARDDDRARHAFAALAAVEGAVVRVRAGLRELAAEGLARAERWRLERAVVGCDGVTTAAVVRPHHGRARLDRQLPRLELEVLDAHARRSAFVAARLSRTRRRESEGERDERDDCDLSHLKSPLTHDLAVPSTS